MAELLDVLEQVRAIEQAGVRPGADLGHAQSVDPNVVYVLVVFESEERARAREQDPRRQAGLAGVRAAMADALDGPPEFVDLDVLYEL